MFRLVFDLLWFAGCCCLWFVVDSRWFFCGFGLIVAFMTCYLCLRMVVYLFDLWLACCGLSLWFMFGGLIVLFMIISSGCAYLFCIDCLLVWFSCLGVVPVCCGLCSSCVVGFEFLLSS